MKSTTMRIIAIATTAILSLGGAFLAGSQSTDVEKTKTVTDPIEHCVTASLKNFPTPIDVQLDECKSLSEEQKMEANAIVMNFLDEVAEYEMTN